MSENESVKQVVLVGHCMPDTYMLKSTLPGLVGGVPIQAVNDAASIAKAGPESLLLVNRALDGEFGTDNGIELIRTLAQRSPRPRLMLISNYAEAQQQAVSAGALPGFGKSELGKAQTRQRLQAAVEGGKDGS